MPWQLIGSGLVGLGTIATTVYLLRANRIKIEAEADEIVGRTYKELILSMRDEINENKLEIEALRGELEHERQRNYALEAWSKALTTQVIELGGIPVLYSDYRKP